MTYRNYKIIFKNIVLKKNIIFIHAYNLYEAGRQADSMMRKMGLIQHGSEYRDGARVQYYAPAEYTHRQMLKKKSDRIRMEIIDLHVNRRRK